MIFFHSNWVWIFGCAFGATRFSDQLDFLISICEIFGFCQKDLYRQIQKIFAHALSLNFRYFECSLSFWNFAILCKFGSAKFSAPMSGSTARCRAKQQGKFLLICGKWNFFYNFYLLPLSCLLRNFGRFYISESFNWEQVFSYMTSKKSSKSIKYHSGFVGF